MKWSNTQFDKILDTQEDKDKFYTYYNSNTELLDELVKAFEEKIKIAQSLSDAADTYDSPNWPYKQADLVGYRRGIQEVVNLLNIRDNTTEEKT